jgi:hypothetical protein
VSRIARLFFQAHGTTPGAQALTDALLALEGIAFYEGRLHDVHLRLAGHEGAIYLDLADEFWQAVEITSTGWRIVADPPVFFRRPRGMLALPYPISGGQLDDLREFVNVADDDWPLIVGWLVAALRPQGPYPVLPVHGEQGSAKSTTVRVLRELIDPNVAPLRSEPRNGRDLAVTADAHAALGAANSERAARSLLRLQALLAGVDFELPLTRRLARAPVMTSDERIAAHTAAAESLRELSHAALDLTQKRMGT